MKKIKLFLPEEEVKEHLWPDVTTGRNPERQNVKYEHESLLLVP